MTDRMFNVLFLRTANSARSKSRDEFAAEGAPQKRLKEVGEAKPATSGVPA